MVSCSNPSSTVKIQVSPSLSQMTDDQISQHHHQRMTASIPFNAHIPGPHLKMNRLARPESLFHQSQVLVTIMYGLSIGILLWQIAFDHVTTVQPGCLRQCRAILLQAQLAIGSLHLQPAI